MPSCLLGRHVGRRAEDDARLGQREVAVCEGGGCHRSGRGAGEGRSRPSGQSEIENLDRAVAADHDVGGLQITVDDSRLVRGFERSGDLRKNLVCLVYRQWALRESCSERRPVDELHREREHAVRLFDAVDGGDVGVIE